MALVRHQNLWVAVLLHARKPGQDEKAWKRVHIASCKELSRQQEAVQPTHLQTGLVRADLTIPAAPEVLAVLLVTVSVEAVDLAALTGFFPELLWETRRCS